MPMLHERIKQHASTSGERVAVVAAGRRMSYDELWAAAERVRDAVVGRGLGPGNLVGLYLPRGGDVIAGLVGVLGAGAAYAVIEDDGDELNQVTKDRLSTMDHVVTHPPRLPHLSEMACSSMYAGEYQSIETDTIAPRASDAAYVMFTSGSTGKPKGVTVTHGNIEKYLAGVMQRLGVRSPIDCAHVSSLAADLGNTALFLALWTGGTVHLVDDSVRKDPRALLEYLERERVHLLKITPSHWSAVMSCIGDGRRRTHTLLEYLVLGGEGLSKAFAERVLQAGIATTLVNHYGPTETTIGVAAFVVRPEHVASLGDHETVPVGAPLGETRFWLRCDDGSVTDKGEGELFVGGPFVADGYWRAPEITAQCFGPLSGGPPGRYYKTGDLVRIASDGIATFLGRSDRQAKVNGFRVELEQIETAIRSLRGDIDVVVFDLTRSGGHGLIAVVGGPQRVDAADLKRELLQKLPSYMIPGRWIVQAHRLPRNANGKMDVPAIRAQMEDVLKSEPSPVPGVTSPENAGRPEASKRVVRLWQRLLRHDRFNVDTNFFDAGGNSLDAIELVGHLQSDGVAIAYSEFLAQPTVRQLTALLAQRDQDARQSRLDCEADDAMMACLSSAQRAFLDLDLPEPHHWNQALLLEFDAPLDIQAFRAGIADLLEWHTLLRTVYRRSGDSWRAVAAKPQAVFSFTDCESSVSASASEVWEWSERLQQEINIFEGPLFRVHAWSGQPSLLLLVAHHLCVDGVSWRIIVRDLAAAYSARLRGRAPAKPYSASTFWQWAKHIESQADSVSRRFESWWQEGGGGAPTPTRRAQLSLEGAARTCWIAFSPTETALLQDRIYRESGANLHSAVLAALVMVLGDGGVGGSATVDVESHGRVSLDQEVDTSRVVGWFTSTFPVRLQNSGDLKALARRAERALVGVPDLGVGYSLKERRPAQQRLLYNYLGPFEFEYGETDLNLRPSALPIAPARGKANPRSHDLKFTARIVRGQLVCDLCFDPEIDLDDRVSDAMRRLHRLLLELVTERPPSEPSVVFTRGSSTGLLTYTPRECLSDGSSTPPRREYSNVLLTGATGYIGLHLLRLLLKLTDTRVLCVVRGNDIAGAMRRLVAAYQWQFPDDDAKALRERCTVYCGDMERANFGLTEDTFGRLAGELDAVYHLASNTRLVGGARDFRGNLESVRTVLDLARRGRPKDVHYASTLAVAGLGNPKERRTFSETSLDIGQILQNGYERSKLDAERLLNAHAAQGVRVFIYRAGNVTGDSVTGRFQRNASNNRLVQLLIGIVRTGRSPAVLEDEICLAPVDVVARAILEISRCRDIVGGTFHLQTQHKVSVRQILLAIERSGHRLRPSDAGGVEELLTRFGDTSDPAVLLARFWSRRPVSNVEFDHARSAEVLNRLGVEFPALDDAWLMRFVEGISHVFSPAGKDAKSARGTTGDENRSLP